MKQVEITSKIIGRGGSTTSASPSLDLSGYALISDLLNYVTISGNEDVTGLHDFVNGLKIGGIELIQKNGNAFLKGNLVVEGGITMYGDGEGGSSVPLYSTLGSLENVDKDAIDAVASVDRVLFQSAGSNVWSWKALSEIGGGSSGGSVSGAVRYLSTLGSSGSWYDSTYRLYGEWGLHDRLYLKTEGGYDVVANLAEKDGNGNIIASTYLPLSGGTLTGNLTLGNSSNTSHIGYYINRSGNTIGLAPDYNCACLRFATSTSKTNYLRLANGVLDLSYDGGTNWNNILHAGNISSYNAGSATKLQTARTIWGQSFDGTGNVNGQFLSSLNVSTSTWVSDTAQIRANATGTKYYIGVAATTNGLAVIQGGNKGTGSIPLLLNPSGGYVGIGIESPSTKLHVNGGLTCNNIIVDMESDKNASVNLRGTTTDLWQISARYGADKGTLKFYYYNGSTWAQTVVVTSAGNVTVLGGVTMYSDQRKKTILNHVELSLKQIANAPLIEHYYNSDQDKTTHVGSIAQYWASMNDWFCKLDAEGFYTMEIQNCALASAISIARHLEKYESKTDKTIRKMKQRIQELEDEVERLKKN